MKIQSFLPIANRHSQVLILGTMPGERSLALQQYYGHGGNHFWKILFQLFDLPFSKDYNDRSHLLLKNKIALWDVAESCIRKGSADAQIRDEVPNDIEGLLLASPLITDVFFNGKKAAELYDAYFTRKSTLSFHLLPSTSSANGWKTFEEKLSEWASIKTLLR